MEQFTARQHSSRKSWILAIAVFVILTGIAAYVQWSISRPQPPAPEVPYEAPVAEPEVTTLEEVAEYTAGRPIPPVATEESAGNVGKNAYQEHIRGDLDARFSIVEYGSMMNSYTRLIHPELKTFIEANPDVNWIFRHYPIDRNEMDMPVAKVSECVYRFSGDEGFWAFIDAVYERPAITQLDAAFEMAAELVADADMQKCYDDPIIWKYVQDDKRLGYFLGKVTIVPTFFFVDNAAKQERVLSGVDTIDFFRQIVDTMRQVPA